MLAQSFKSAAELRIKDAHLEALISVLGMLEREELEHACGVQGPFGFNMANHFCRPDGDEDDCGTVGCIAGWAEHIKQLPKGEILDDASDELAILFAGGRYPSIVTPDQAARALRSYLTTGDAKWHEAVAMSSAHGETP